MRKIYFKDMLFEPRIKDILRLTSLCILSNKDVLSNEEKIWLQTQDGEEWCMAEYDMGEGCSNPHEAIITSFCIGSKYPKKLFKELENKLYFRFIDC